MRIVHIEDFFHPDAGYQINILSKYMSRLAHEVYVVTSELEKIPRELTSFFERDHIAERDEEFRRKTGVSIIRARLSAYVSGRAIYSRQIFSIVDSIRPDILYVHGNDTMIGIEYTLRARRLKYPLIMDNHMLEMSSKNRLNKVFRRLYRLFITPIIKKHKITVIRTQDDPYVIDCLGIPEEQSPWISTGSDLLMFHADNRVKEQFRTVNRINKNEMIALYIGKLDRAKDGMLLAKAFEKKFVNKKNKDIVLVVVGNSVGDYGREVENVFSRSENRIIRFPTQKYVDLPKFYQIGDFAIFPSQCSLSFFDAQACKLPVLAEDNNINIDRLSYGNGLIFKKGDVSSLREQIIRLIEMDETEIQEMGENAYRLVKNHYNYNDIVKQYMSTMIESYNRYHKKYIP